MTPDSLGVVAALRAAPERVAEARTGATRSLADLGAVDGFDHVVFCGMGGSGVVGDIVAAGAADRAVALLDEISAIAAGQGFAPRSVAAQRARTMLTAAGSPFTASMLRDVENGRAIEADHVLGDLLKRAGAKPTPMLSLAHAHLKAYEARRARQ